MRKYPTLITPPGRYKYLTTENDYPIRNGGSWTYHSLETLVLYSDFDTLATLRWQWVACRLVWENKE
jgi:hypothetical protein